MRFIVIPDELYDVSISTNKNSANNILMILFQVRKFPIVYLITF